MISDQDIERYDSQGVVPPLRDIEQWMEVREKQQQLVKKMHKKAMGRKTIRCPTCGKSSQIGSIDLSIHMRRVPSYNSYEDAYDTPDRVMCQCPKCDEHLLLHRYNEPISKYGQFEIKEYFKSITEIESKRR
jgi:endogenous inhibitor of DNA gyrase (YacG/DUF329 family)